MQALAIAKNATNIEAGWHFELALVSATNGKTQSYMGAIIGWNREAGFS